MLTRQAALTCFDRSREDLLCERNNIANNPRFVMKHRNSISVVPLIFGNPIAIFLVIYHIVWETGTQLGCAGFNLYLVKLS